VIITRALAAVPGIAAAAALACAATAAGSRVPVLGAPVVAVVAGAALSAVSRRVRALRYGLGIAKGLLLQVAVVLLGAQLSFGQVATTGVRSLPVLAATLATCFGLAWLAGRWLGVSTDVRTLIGMGTGICGASAIAAVSPVIKAKSADVAYAISTIFLFNVAAVVIFPPLGRALGLSQHAFGLFAGTAVNDTSSVVASATAFGTVATGYAVIVKLTRTLAIIPITLWLGTRTHPGRDGSDEQRPLVCRLYRLVPWFLIGFLVVVLLNTAGLLPGALQRGAHGTQAFLVALAMAAVGLSTDAAALRRAGFRPLLLGLICWAAVTGTSLAVGALTL
jgi:uncharacterized integral membrane protein (TIGR00698 family)